MAQVKYKNYIIEVWVELFDPEVPDDVAEYFEKPSEARQYRKTWPAYRSYDIRWAAAEVINDNGDLNPSVRGTTKTEAVGKLKKLLQKHL